MKAIVVLGANAGDEGKGLITDYYAHQAISNGSDVLCCRANGGAQAGHTVVTPDGQRHVFNHFGSGSFTGAPTFFSQHFIHNPITFVREYKVLEGLGISHGVLMGGSSDPQAIVTTPFDMILNTMIEAQRGADRHGSCGMGINETVERSFYPDFLLTIEDLRSKRLLEKLLYIRKHWVSMRAAELGISADVIASYRDRIFDDGILDHFCADARFLSKSVRSTTFDLLTKYRYSNVVFEGAQGLLLDQDDKYAPYNTRSNTGVKNVIEILNQIPAPEQLDITYVTRWYLTRHGAGPLPNEVESIAGVYDNTNLANKFQGTLRFAPLDIDSLNERITTDLQHARLYDYQRIVAVTCLDQCLNVDSPGLLTGALRRAGNNNILQSYGPTRNDVKHSWDLTYQ